MADKISNQSESANLSQFLIKSAENNLNDTIVTIVLILVALFITIIFVYSIAQYLYSMFNKPAECKPCKPCKPCNSNINIPQTIKEVKQVNQDPYISSIPIVQSESINQNSNSSIPVVHSETSYLTTIPVSQPTIAISTQPVASSSTLSSQPISSTISNTPSVPNSAPPSTTPPSTTQSILSTTVAPFISAVKSTMESLPSLSSIGSEQIQVKNVATEKQNYKKLEEITLPSSKIPYISRDQICYKEHLNDADYVSKREGCMACKVDTSDKWKDRNYNNTNTNIVNTCTYSSKPSDSSIWDKNRCVTECSKMQDIVL